MNKVCNIGYFGSISDFYCLNILNNLSILLPSDEFKIHVCGSFIDGAEDIASDVCYHGYLSGEAFAAFCANINIFINPREYSETITSYSFPSKLYEYMSYCKPVISTPIPHVSETTANFINFSSDYSVKAVKDRIIEVWKNYDAYLLDASRQKRYLRELDVGLVLYNFIKELK